MDHPAQSHWDRYGKRDQNSSLWIHVNNPWAGDSFGSVNIPRIGQEVIVDFLGGNPEEPIIVGRMHTNLLRPAMTLPANKTQSGFKSSSVPHTGGYNELMFEDKAGSEFIRTHAEKDMMTRVNHDQSSSIGNNRTDSVQGNDAESVQGNQSNQVAGQFMQTVAQDAMQQLMSNLGSFVGKDRVFGTQGGFSSQADTHTVTSKKGTVLQVGSSTIYIGPDAIVIQSPKVLLNPGENVVQNAVVTGQTSAAGAQA